MSIITDHIKKKLEKDIRTSGLLVWLDKENEFIHLVDTWINQKKEGLFPYDIFAFRGSFLELMIEAKEVLSDKYMPKCVIHMPGFNAHEVKQTPVLEAYKAGKRWRISLHTMIREAAQGRLSEKQISFLLSKKGLTLSKADTFITDNEGIPQEIQQLLNKYGEDGFVLEFIKNPDQINKDMCLPSENCFPILISYFDKLIGLDHKWQLDWNLDKVNYSHPDNQVDLLISFLMLMEFVHDLRCDPGSERLMRLKKNKRNIQKNQAKYFIN
ncbi:MAG: PglZ domain protein [Candidatus Magnetoglobus multicellularis str. Araruama]|uniref:PglZ domain protein n=1 Tax=Candidatus Magnetoglobus multicellularis str. Araruama TaxID=890399 RepID=A0A1V1PHR4_9BACT|nr:MAG: PglZ domain protein [Candidatus Magnetoglobus multicellularis str. Araruama]